MEKPYEYYCNNVYGMLCLLDVLKENNVNKIVFSSTAATYGDLKSIPIIEADDTGSTNTYGETKLAIEKMIKWFDQAHSIKYVSHRYFNDSEDYETGEIGEDHHPETHLIPLILLVPLEKMIRFICLEMIIRMKMDMCKRLYPCHGSCFSSL